jgi:hypothetical protein
VTLAVILVFIVRATVCVYDVADVIAFFVGFADWRIVGEVCGSIS